MSMSAFWRILLAAALTACLSGCFCTPFAPDLGLFLNSGVTFAPVTATGTTVGANRIALNGQNQVEVTTSNGTVTKARVDVPIGMDPYFLFTGNNRFLLLDMHAASGVSRQFQQVTVDLAASPPVLGGHALPQQAKLVGLQVPSVHIYPSPGNSLAFLVWYGMGNNVIENAEVFRSDTGAKICGAVQQSFTASIQVEARVTTTGIDVLDGGNIISAAGSCLLPSGMLDVVPPTQAFTPILANTTEQRVFALKNTGNDCCQIAAIMPSQHFHAVNFTPIDSLAANASQPVTIVFDPHNDIGSFTETLMVTRTPNRGVDRITVSATALAPSTTLTVTNILRPAADPGRFNLLVDGTVLATNVGNGGTTGAQNVLPGTHSVSETGPANYVTSFGGDCAANGTVTLLAGDQKTCTITNLGQPLLTVTKILRPASDPGRFNLQVDGVTRASNVGDGGTSGAQTTAPGTHIISETGTPGNYTRIFGGDCAGSGSVTLAAGDDKTCTITNQTSFDSARITITASPGSLPGPNGSGTVSVTVLNNGTTTWQSPAYLLNLWRVRWISLPINWVALPVPVSPGQSINLSFTVQCNGTGTGGFSAQMGGPGGRFNDSAGQNIVCQ
jgi:hypothetical protein